MSDIQQRLMLFPTLAHYDASSSTWLADVHGWCFDNSEAQQFQRTTASLLRRALKVDRSLPDPPLFRERAAGFVVENRKKIVIDVGHQEQKLLSLKTKRNGHFRAEVNVTVDQIKDHSGMTPGIGKAVLSALRTDCKMAADGDLYLIPDSGLSIISDIDDTIKFSNVGNKSELLANTFLRPFRAIEGMAEVFQSLDGPNHSFHYISASPWQLIDPIGRFLREHHFPEGSVHLRKFALKDVTILKKVFPAHKKKKKVIEKLIQRFPRRQFLLIGDTGEFDPEIYGEIARRYPDQIAGLCLRNVTHDAPDSLRFRRAFVRIDQKKWIVFEDAMRLESQFLPGVLGRVGQMAEPSEYQDGFPGGATGEDSRSSAVGS